MKRHAGVAVDVVAIVAASALLFSGRIGEATWAAVVVPVVAYWLRSRLRGGPPPSGGAALFVLVGLIGATLGVRGGGTGA